MADPPQIHTVATHWGNHRVHRDGSGNVLHVEPGRDDPAPSVIGLETRSPLTRSARVLRPAVRQSWLENRGFGSGDRRGVDAFVELPWEDAQELVAEELRFVADEYGNKAIFGGSYGWGSAGRFHHAQSQIHRFLAMAGGYTGSANSYSMGAIEVLLPRIIGASGSDLFAVGPTWDEIADHAQLVVAIGGLPRRNGQANSGGIGRHTAPAAQRRCRENGVRFVSISPIASDIDEDLGAEWISIRPNTDVALLLGIAHTLIVEGLYDRDFLVRCTEGFESFRQYVLGAEDGQVKTPQWAAGIAGVDPRTIIELAREMASSRTALLTNWAIQRADHGEQPLWTAIAVAAMSGSMGRPGGGYGLGHGTMGAVGLARRRHRVAAVPQPRNRVESRVPVARIADMLLNPGAQIDFNGSKVTYPDIQLIYWAGGNPFHHHQDLHRLVRGWQRPRTVIVHESYWTPTARHADVVLPTSTFMERNDIACGTLDSTLAYSQRTSEPLGESRSDYDIFCGLSERLGFGDLFSQRRTADDWLRALYSETREDLARQGLSLPDFEGFTTAQTLDLGYPEPTSDPMILLRQDPEMHSLSTPSGRVEITSNTIASFRYADCPGHPTWLEPAEWLGSDLATTCPFHLISSQPATRLHSQLDHGDASQASKVRGREPIRMCAETAQVAGVRDGEVVRVFNSRGSCLAGVVIDALVRPMVVQLATGAWFDPSESGNPSAIERHGNPNVLTLDIGTSRLAQACSAQTALVNVEPYLGELEPVRAFDPPPLLPTTP